MVGHVESEEPLKLTLKCIDHEKYGKLYALNKELSEDEKEKVKAYFKKFKPIDFENVMNIEGNPYGWMCTEENVTKVENALNIKETLEIQKEKRINSKGIKRKA